MKYTDLTEVLVDDYKPRKREPNRVSVTSVHAMLVGWEDRPINFKGVMNMWRGTMKHNALEPLLQKLGYQTEIKMEHQTPYDWVLVGIVDAMADDHLLEIKTTDSILDTAKEWHVTQGRLYCSMFERPSCTIVQPVIDWENEKLYLKHLRSVKRNDKWFENTLQRIDEIIKGRGND